MSAVTRHDPNGQTRPLAYQRALSRLSRMHHDQFADLLAAERFRVDLPPEQRKGRHGTASKYAGGCRCARCREAVRKIKRTRVARAKVALSEDDPRHGSANAYKNLACRCDPCREANRIAQRDYWERRRAREASA